MCSPFRSKRRESSRELEKGNSIRELACNDSIEVAWGPGGRALVADNLF